MALMCEEMTALFISILILHQAATTTYAQDDFISLDCGSPAGTNYTEDDINYISDESFIEGGVSTNLSGFQNNTKRIYETRRSFLNNDTRICYTLRLPKGKNNKYMIRAKFKYGDPNSQLPRFDLYFGGDIWLKQLYVDGPFVYFGPELIHVSISDFINVCLRNIGQGYPFITTLELRPLDITMYNQSQSLRSHGRVNFGTTEDQLRYKDDKYDRIWYSYKGKDFGLRAIQASDAIVLEPLSKERVPLKVMKTAVTPINSTDPISYSWGGDIVDEFTIYIHLAEVEEILLGTQKREFNISVNGNWIATVSPSTTITTITSHPMSGSSTYELRLTRTINSTLPPILNALEVYRSRHIRQNQTDDLDVAAIWSVKSSYGLKNLNWLGDPCIPEAWVGLKCGYHDPGATKIISLNLSSRGITGDITTALANLTMMELLDLSYNNLTGSVPKFLAQLENLKKLYLVGNNFTRPLPSELVDKVNKGSLQLSIEELDGVEDTISCSLGSCRRKKNKVSLVPILASIVGCILIVSIVAYIVKKLRNKALMKTSTTGKQKYTYTELVVITKDFKDIIGSGGFGRVYLGSVNDKQVAVKMLSKASPHYDYFQTEVKLVMGIRHKNITALIGYCDDRHHKGIIYEFMAKGSLEEHLFDGNQDVLSWERRIQIGCDVAEGLAYMHHGCKPPIVHRDIKPSNILLSGGLEAKLTDFGLSRAFPTEDASHLTADLVGTMGYLDPRYCSTRRVTEKNDVYSFGVVLLVLITSRATSYETHITHWVKRRVEEGNVENIIDPKLLDGHFDKGVVSKVVNIAIACISNEPDERPTMNDVAMVLKQCVQVVVNV